jgi:N6-adenosine-specific RNA methylase IME4
MPLNDMFPNNGPYLQVQNMKSKPAASISEIVVPITRKRRAEVNGLILPAKPLSVAGEDLLNTIGGRKFGTILADPPWQFQNRTGKVAPEHKRLSRYGTMTLDDIKELPVASVAADIAHLYLWVPNALLPDGIAVMQAWGFQYKSNLVWHKIRKDGGSDGRGVGFYFRNVTELILFGVRGKNARTLKPGRTQVNYLSSRKREHSRKPDEQYNLIEACSPGPFLELFARGDRKKWITWGNQADDSYEPTWKTYAYHSQNGAKQLAMGD